jgi:hypothetical protein
MDVDEETVFSPNRHDHSKRISYTQVMWWQKTHKNFHEVLIRELIIHSHEENVTANAFQGVDQVHLCPSSVDWK